MQRSSPSSLLSIDWWREAVKGVWRVAGRFWLAAALLALSNIVVVVGNDYVIREIGVSAVDTEKLMRVGLVGFGCCIGGLLLTLWALGLWLVKLTAYARAACLSDGTPSIAEFDDAISEAGRRGGYLTKFWLVASIYLVVPSVPLIILMTLRVLAWSPQVSRMIFPVAPPLWLLLIVDVVMAVFAVLTAAYSLTALTVSSVSTRKAAAAATEALTLAARNWRGVLVSGGLVLLINLLVSAPATIGSAVYLAGTARLPVWIDVVGQIWLGFATAFVWPLSVRSFCQLLKGQLKGHIE